MTRCPHCGTPDADCAAWSDAELAWVCERTDRVVPDELNDPDLDDDPDEPTDLEPTPLED